MMMWIAETEAQILNRDMIVAVVIAITTCWLQVSHWPYKSPLTTLLVKAVCGHFNDGRKYLRDYFAFWYTRSVGHV